VSAATTFLRPSNELLSSLTSLSLSSYELGEKRRKFVASVGRWTHAQGRVGGEGETPSWGVVDRSTVRWNGGRCEGPCVCGRSGGRWECEPAAAQPACPPQPFAANKLFEIQPGHNCHIIKKHEKHIFYPWYGWICALVVRFGPKMAAKAALRQTDSDSTQFIFFLFWKTLDAFFEAFPLELAVSPVLAAFPLPSSTWRSLLRGHTLAENQPFARTNQRKIKFLFQRKRSDTAQPSGC
jgi:hypothetical protein